MFLYMSVANKIKELREKAGLTMTKLAERSGVAQPLISRYESGKHVPGQAHLKKIARALKVSLSELLEDDDAGLGASLPQDPGQRLDYFLSQAGMSGTELAERIGVDPTTINKFRRGHNQEMSLDVTMRVCDALGITPYDLMGLTPPTHRLTLQQTLPLEAPRAPESLERGERPDPAVMRRIAELQGYVETQRPLDRAVNAQEWRMRDFVDEIRRLSNAVAESQAQIARLQSVSVNDQTRFAVLVSILDQIVLRLDLPETIRARLRAVGE